LQQQKLRGARILVTGATGFLGRYVMAELSALGAEPIPLSKSKHGIDFRNEAEVLEAVLYTRPDIVVHLAGKTGGIAAHEAQPAFFFRENLTMGMNVVHAASVGRAKLVAIGSASSYPEDCAVPFKEEDFWNGAPEPTSRPEGIAKKALLAMMQAYRKQFRLSFAYLVPADLYGPGEKTQEEESSVLSAMIERFLDARERGLKETACCWGTGKMSRSFLFVADAAKAVALAAAELDHDLPVNLPGSPEIQAADLAVQVAKAVGYEGKIVWDASKPEGPLRRVLDGTRAKKLLGWTPETSFQEGLKAAVDWHREESTTPD
jgi:GDP-L-fucose synthase